MAIETVLEAVREHLFVVLGQTGEAKPTYHVGADRQDEQDAPPRIVWVLRGGMVTNDGADGGTGSLSEPRALFQRNERCDAHIWAEDFDSCERLMNHLVAAIQVIAPGSWRPLSTNWDIGQDGKNSDGRVVVLAVEFWIPFTRELYNEVEVLEAIPIIPEVDPLGA